MDYTPMLDTARRAAREAGALMRASSGKPVYQQWKNAHEIVVGSVFPIQEKIIEIIRADFPNDAILAEERETQPALESDPLWIVDPVDGSLNFHQGIPHAAISIAYRAGGIDQVGVVYDPFRDEMFDAMRGRSARLNDQPIVVQQVSEGEDAYAQAIVGADLPGELATRLQTLNIATLMASQCTGLTIMGSPALGLCYVAAGRLHAYFALGLELWDVAAASVILVESGGILTDIRGGSWLHTTGGYIASNGVIHGWMMRNAQTVFWKDRQE
ncbi:MAG: inositol monophosphatase [Chloroflexi bacterium]|nr:inositol monophosphatase [Chloroflexota bacterium]